MHMSTQSAPLVHLLQPLLSSHHTVMARSHHTSSGYNFESSMPCRAASLVDAFKLRQPPSVRCGSSLQREELRAQLKIRFERRQLVFDACLTSKGFTRTGASKVCPWCCGSPLAWMASTLSTRSTVSCQNSGTQQIEDAEEQGLAPKSCLQGLLWLAPCSSCWKTLLKSSWYLLESWGKQQKKWHPGRRKTPPCTASTEGRESRMLSVLPLLPKLSALPGSQQELCSC